jgi:putative transposase
MSKKRRQFTANFKFKVALEAAKGTKSISQISSETGVHPNQISQWKRQLLEEGASLFKKNAAKQQRQQDQMEAELYEQIGRLKMELEWLKKELICSIEDKRAMIESNHTSISISRLSAS